jgi:flagellar export protein FliJ
VTSKRISKILELKQFAKDICETELKKSLESLQTEEAKLNFIEKKLQKTFTDYKKMHEDGLINIYELEMFYDYLLHMSKQAEKQKEVISKESMDVEKKKDKVISAHREKKMVEIIHNKMLTKENKESEKKEEKESDLNFLHGKTRR